MVLITVKFCGGEIREWESMVDYGSIIALVQIALVQMTMVQIALVQMTMVLIALVQTTMVQFYVVQMTFGSSECSVQINWFK